MYFFRIRPPKKRTDHVSLINPFSDLGKETQNPFLDFPKKRTLSHDPTHIQEQTLPALIMVPRMLAHGGSTVLYIYVHVVG